MFAACAHSPAPLPRLTCLTCGTGSRGRPGAPSAVHETILESMTNRVMSLDANGSFPTVNRDAASMLSLDPDEVQGGGAAAATAGPESPAPDGAAAARSREDRQRIRKTAEDAGSCPVEVRTSSEKVAGLAAAEGDATRLRVGLQGSWRGDALTPRLEVGIRQDGGDAETGFGADIGAGLAWWDAARGIAVDVSARGLLTHEASGFRDRGIAGTLSWDPTPGSDRGASLTLGQSFGGSSQGGMDALLGRETLAGLAANDNGAGDGGDELRRRRLDLRLGYGLSALGDRFTSTPELGLGLSNDSREYSLGWRLNLTRGGPVSLELGLAATRREQTDGTGDAEHAIGFRMTARF